MTEENSYGMRMHKRYVPESGTYYVAPVVGPDNVWFTEKALDD